MTPPRVIAVPNESGSTSMAASSNPTASFGPIRLLWLMAEGNYIKELRLEMGITQEDLAIRVGLANKQMISAIETGRLHVPPERAYDFADALSVGRRTFCMRLLRYQNAWLWGGVFGIDKPLAAELAAATPLPRSRSDDGAGSDGPSA